MAERLTGGAVALVVRLLARRVLLLLAMLALTFLAVEVLPSDAAQAGLSAEASPAEVAARRVQLGLDRPVTVRFLHWIGGLLTGDLGTSSQGQPVWALVRQPFANTLELGGLALLLTAVLALVLGALAVLHPGGPLDRAVSSSATVLVTLPEFVVAIALVLVFALWLRALPAVTVSTSGGTPASAAMLVLPVLGLALRQVGWNTRIVRAALAERLRAPYVDSALMDGLSRRRIVLRYLLPEAAPTIAAGLATSVGMVLGGAVAVETIFNFPGLGAILLGAIHARDAPLLADVVALAGLAVSAVLVAADLLRAWAVGGRR